MSAPSSESGYSLPLALNNNHLKGQECRFRSPFEDRINAQKQSESEFGCPRPPSPLAPRLALTSPEALGLPAVEPQEGLLPTLKHFSLVQYTPIKVSSELKF